MDNEMLYLFQEAFEEAFRGPEGAQLITQMVVQLFQSLFGIAAYVLTALGLYTIAKRRGISHAWLSWIPVVDVWVLGAISDQYHQVTRSENKGKRKALLTLSILVSICVAILLGLLVAFFVAMFQEIAGTAVSEDALVVGVLVFVVAVLALIGMSIALAIIEYMALYDLYRAASPKNAVLFLVLSIFVGVTMPFFVFFNRNKDEGMVPVYQLGCQPQQPYPGAQAPYQAPQAPYQAPQAPYQAPQAPYQAPQVPYQAPQAPEQAPQQQPPQDQNDPWAGI